MKKHDDVIEMLLVQDVCLRKHNTQKKITNLNTKSIIITITIIINRIIKFRDAMRSLSYP